MQNYNGYAQMDFLLTNFINENENSKFEDLKWILIPAKILKKLTVPEKEFNKKIIDAFAVFVGEHEIKDKKTNLYYVFGKYIRKDYYSKNKFDEKTDYFFTLYSVDQADPDLVYSAKYQINQREYKSWLIDRLEEGKRYKTSLEVKARSNKIEQIYTLASNVFKSALKSDDSNNDSTDLEELF